VNYANGVGGGYPKEPAIARRLDDALADNEEPVQNDAIKRRIEGFIDRKYDYPKDRARVRAITTL
jgi:hypothetical protein